MFVGPSPPGLIVGALANISNTETSIRFIFLFLLSQKVDDHKSIHP
jgi:hypothetical protein